jgi:hypothetical protein
MAGRAMNASDIQLAAQAATSIGPVFWLWGIAIIFQTFVFGILGAWGVSRFINRLISEIRKEIAEAVKELTNADQKVEKQTGDTIAAMRQHVSNIERDFDRRCHAIELKAEKDRNHDLEHFVRRDSFLHVTGKIESAMERLATDVNSQFDKMAEKIDEIRDRKAA